MFAKKTKRVSLYLAGNSGLKSANTFNSVFKASTKEFDWNYIQIKINQEETKTLDLSCSMIHFWKNENYLGIGIPNVDSSVSLLHFFKKINVNDIKHVIQTYTTSLRNLKNLNLERLGVIREIKAEKWFIKDKIILIGDAAHSLYPFLGQGMNAALQDVELLGQLLRTHECSNAFALFQKIRKKELDILKTKSANHFFLLKSPKFLTFKTLMRQFDLQLAKLTHNVWLEEYSAMSNSTIRIDKIFRRIKFQRIIKCTPLYFLPLFFYCVKRKIMI